MKTQHPENNIYYGPNIKNALKCLRLCQNKNAVSWMEKDLTEICSDLNYGDIDPHSLKITDTGCIEYQVFSETK